MTRSIGIQSAKNVVVAVANSPASLTSRLLHMALPKHVRGLETAPAQKGLAFLVQTLVSYLLAEKFAARVAELTGQDLQEMRLREVTGWKGGSRSSIWENSDLVKGPSDPKVRRNLAIVAVVLGTATVLTTLGQARQALKYFEKGLPKGDAFDGLVKSFNLLGLDNLKYNVVLFSHTWALSLTNTAVKNLFLYSIGSQLLSGGQVKSDSTLQRVIFSPGFSFLTNYSLFTYMRLSVFFKEGFNAFQALEQKFAKRNISSWEQLESQADDYGAR